MEGGMNLLAARVISVHTEAQTALLNLAQQLCYWVRGKENTLRENESKRQTQRQTEADWAALGTSLPWVDETNFSSHEELTH